MNIDERLDRLTERHEALTQSVELMAAENKERDARLGRVLGQIMDALEKLVHVAESHEHRLSDLEGEQG